MAYDQFIKEYIAKGFLKAQKPNISTVEKLILRSGKDLISAKANIVIDEGIAYTVAYLAMLRAGRAYMLLKGFRPDDRQQHKTVIEFVFQCLDKEYANLFERFERMRRKRNIFTYEVDVDISLTEAENAFETAVKFIKLIKDTIKRENPQRHFKF